MVVGHRDGKLNYCVRLGARLALTGWHEGIRILEDFYISLYISIHFDIFLCVFAYVLHAFVYIFLTFSSYKIDS